MLPTPHSPSLSASNSTRASHFPQFSHLTSIWCSLQPNWPVEVQCTHHLLPEKDMLRVIWETDVTILPGLREALLSHNSLSFVHPALGNCGELVHLDLAVLSLLPIWLYCWAWSRFDDCGNYRTIDFPHFMLLLATVGSLHGWILLRIYSPAFLRYWFDLQVKPVFFYNLNHSSCQSHTEVR